MSSPVDQPGANTMVANDVAASGSSRSLFTRDAVRQKDREEVKAWLHEAWRASGKRQRTLSELMGLEYHWLGNRLAPSCDVCPTRDQLAQFADLTKHPLTPSLLAKWDRLEASLHHSQDGRNVVLDLSTLAPMTPDGTAESEMANLINLAHSSKRQAGTKVERNVQFMRLRFGVGADAPMTLAEVGECFGLTRERVRQVEAKMLTRLAAVAVDFETPALEEIRLASMGKTGQPLALVESEMRSRLGRVSLIETLRFYQAIRPGDTPLRSERAGIYRLGGVKVLAASDADLRMIKVVSTSARKMQSYCGACLITDLRGMVDATLKAPLAPPDLIRAVEALPGMAWLGSGKRWFWFPDAEMSSLLNRACVVLALAGNPVDFEVLYAGLLRESRRSKEIEAAEFTEAAPPGHVVLAMLDAHPAFVRRVATSFQLAIPFDPLEHMEEYHQALVTSLNLAGGALARHQLREVRSASGKVFSAGYLTISLYLAAFIERLGPSVYGIRGRNIDNNVLAAALHAAQEHLAAAGLGSRLGVASSFTVQIPITPALKRNRLISFRQSVVPAGAGGDYVFPDGHLCTLVDDVHGIRMTGLGAELKALITNSEGSLEFSFDLESREATFRVREATWAS